MTDRPAIPTTFQGVRYRSRLEARWAFLFTAFGWKYEYEPIDANGYIPDFLITSRERPLLIEVKPAVTVKDYCQALPKIYDGLRGCWDYDFLVVGGRPYIENFRGNTTAGIYVNNELGLAATAAWWMWRGESGDPGPFVYLKPSYTQTGGVAGPQVACSLLDDLWRKAGNTVQWKPKAQKANDPSGGR